MNELIVQIEGEIAEIERRLAFWQQQERLQTGQLATKISLLIAGYSVQLDQLHAARNLLDA